MVLDYLVCLWVLVRLEKCEEKVQNKHKFYNKVERIKTGVRSESVCEDQNVPDAWVANEEENPNVENWFPSNVRADDKSLVERFWQRDFGFYLVLPILVIFLKSASV